MKWPMKLLIVVAVVIAVVVVLTWKGSNCCNTCSVPDSASTSQPATAETSPAAPQPSKPLPKLVDLGSTQCVPCKQMEPVLEDLRREYAGKLIVEFIDVRKNPEAAQPYGIRLIPTQIFLSADGKELYRHEGAISKEDILGCWSEFGVTLE